MIFLMDNVNPFDDDEYGAMHAFLELVIWCVALLVVICTITGFVLKQNKLTQISTQNLSVEIY